MIIKIIQLPSSTLRITARKPSRYAGRYSAPQKTQAIRKESGKLKVDLWSLITDFTIPLSVKTSTSVNLTLLESRKRQFLLLNRPFLSSAYKNFSIHCSDRLQSDYINVEATSVLSLNLEAVPPRLDNGHNSLSSHEVNNHESLQSKAKVFRNRFLNFVCLSSVLNNAAEAFSKSEIRRRLFVTAVLIIISRVGYLIPLPGFDRRLIPQGYRSFVSGSVGQTCDGHSFVIGLWCHDHVMDL